ncbi:MAG: hypothetical protein FWE22_01850 [Firmicutes bacterium]|nr:hypothetical protein [Bacillota bacterium]
MKKTKATIYAEQRELKEIALSECKSKIQGLLKPNPTEKELSEYRSNSEQISSLTEEIEKIRLHQKFKKHIEIWVDELDTSYSEMVFSATLNDLKRLRADYKYANEIISLIGRSYQELEMLIRKHLPKKDKKEAPIGMLLKEIEETRTFSKKQMITLRKIINLRNWLTHDVVKEERLYMKKHATLSRLVDMNEWTNYYYTKLVIAKNMLHEAIDLFANYEGSALKNL